MIWYVDSHVHYQTCFGWRMLLQGAFDNLDRWIGADGPADAAGCLCFGDVEGAPGLDSLVQPAGPANPLPDGWRLGPTGDGAGYRIDRETGAPLLLLRGRQVATGERLEVLSLAPRGPLRDGLPLSETVATSLELGAVTVLPWGFGKWWGGRGEIVRRVFEESRAGRLYPGDNGNRARAAGEPPLFERARARNIPVLPGSDPLPFPHHARRALGYGFRLEGPLDPNAPADSLRNALARLDADPVSVGRRVDLPRFVVDQLRMQWVMRRRAAPTEIGRRS